jgi:hypothetical protein
MLSRWLKIKKNAVIYSGFAGALCLLIFALSTQATFYEVRGAIFWDNKTFKNVEAYLLNDKLLSISDTQEETEVCALSAGSFTE